MSIRQPALSGPAAWNSILPAQAAARGLEGDATCDVLVIGAGFAGLSAARRVKQLEPQARVMVLEAGRIAEGSAGRNSGFMIDLPHDLASEDYAGSGDDRAVIRLNRHAIGFAREAVEEFAICPDFFDEVGKVNGAVSEAALAHNRSYAAHLASLGERSEVLDAQQMAELTGSRHYRGGLYTPGTVMLQPAGYIRGLAEGLRGQGVKICEGAGVHELHRAGAAWEAVTRARRVSAERVILSVNGHLESFGFKRGRLMQLFLFAVMTPELPEGAVGGTERWGVTPSDPMGTTVRKISGAQGGRRIITRTCAALRPGMRVNARDMIRAARVMQGKFEARFPELAGLKMEHVWAGHLCLARNSVSVMERLEDGLFAACVQNGLGTARGTLTGMGAAELACGVESEITRHFVREAAPVKLPPQPFLELGGNAALRWKEWRAREE